MEKGRSSVWTGGQRRVWWKEYGYGQIGVFWLRQRRKKGRKDGRLQTMINILLQRPSDNQLAITLTPSLLFKGTDQLESGRNESSCHASRASSLSCDFCASMSCCAGVIHAWFSALHLPGRSSCYTLTLESAFLTWQYYVPTSIYRLFY